MQSGTEVLSDFCDGQAFHTHPLFSDHPNALQLLLYYDDVEVVNPIGSHRKIHKLGTCACSFFVCCLDIA